MAQKVSRNEVFRKPWFAGSFNYFKTAHFFHDEQLSCPPLEDPLCFPRHCALSAVSYLTCVMKLFAGLRGPDQNSQVEQCFMLDEIEVSDIFYPFIADINFLREETRTLFLLL